MIAIILFIGAVGLAFFTAGIVILFGGTPSSFLLWGGILSLIGGLVIAFGCIALALIIWRTGRKHPGLKISDLPDETHRGASLGRIWFIRAENPVGRIATGVVASLIDIGVGDADDGPYTLDN